jgi:hypothetical protein
LWFRLLAFEEIKPNIAGEDFVGPAAKKWITLPVTSSITPATTRSLA